MECNLQVGDKVTPIHKIGPRDGQFYGWETFPEIGGVYTVREVLAFGRAVLIRLVEIVNRPGDYLQGTLECAFLHHHFRRVEKPKRETSIEIFRRIDRDVFSKPTVDA